MLQTVKCFELLCFAGLFSQHPQRDSFLHDRVLLPAQRTNARQVTMILILFISIFFAKVCLLSNLSYVYSSSVVKNLGTDLPSFGTSVRAIVTQLLYHHKHATWASGIQQRSSVTLLASFWGPKLQLTATLQNGQRGHHVPKRWGPWNHSGGMQQLDPRICR